MTTDTPPADRIKSAYCRYCHTARYPDEMYEFRNTAGQKVRRCTHCREKAAKAKSIRGTHDGRPR